MDGHESHGPGSSVGIVSGGTKRPYESSSGESVVSFATDSVSVTQNSIVSGSVANSVLGPDGKRNVKSSSVSNTGCRQRITVVCAECKRLKLKCDRRTPCGSCTKRDTIPRCIYSQAAAEKVDVQSLNIRLQAVEGKLSGIHGPSGSSASAGGSSSRGGGASVLGAGASTAGSGSGHAQQPRAFLAVGAHGASVAVNLEGVAGLWVDHLGLNAPATTPRPPATIAELDLERLGATTVRRDVSGSGIDLRPAVFPSMISDGVLDLVKDTTELFRLPASLVSPPSEVGAAGEETIGDFDAEFEHDHDQSSEGDGEVPDQIGVSPKLVHQILPPPHIRAEIYKRFEQTHLLCPTANFFVFRNEIEEMCRWAEGEIAKSSSSSSGGGGASGSASASRENGNGNGRPDEPPPMTTTTAGSSTMLSSGPSSKPTLTFFAAAALALALGARCWVIEQEVLGNGSNSLEVNGTGPSTSTSAYDRTMPPPPLPPMSSLEPNGSSTSPTSPPFGLPGPSASQPPSPPIQIDPSLPGALYRIAKFALNLVLDCAGYDAFDLDYIHAKCLQVRYLMCSYSYPGEGADILRSAGFGSEGGDEDRRRKKTGRRKADVNGRKTIREEADMSLDEVHEDASPHPIAVVSAPNRRNAKGKERATARGPALALAPEIVGAISDAVGNARMMGLNHDPERTGGGRFSVYEIEMRRRLWWEVVILDAFVAECLGETPLINDNTATTEFPSDVDEEAFGLDSANRPAPNIESMHGNIDHFIQLCRLVDLGKKLRRRTAAFRELHPDAQPGETYELLISVKNEISDWFANLPEYLKLKDITNAGAGASPTILSDAKSPSTKKLPTIPPEREEVVPLEQSPMLAMLRCRLSIWAHHMFVNICLEFNRRFNNKSSGAAAKSGHSKAKEEQQVVVGNLGPSPKGFVTLMMLEPAIYTVHVWRYLHAVLRNVHPALFMCYYFTKELFDTTVVLGHLAIEQPLFASRALATLRLASETIRDPSVLTSKQTHGGAGASGADESGSLPSEAVRIIEELIVKAEAASEAANANFGGFGLSGFGTPPIAKRKHEEVEPANSDLLYHFRFPFVGAGVVSAGPPAAAAAAAPASTVASPQTEAGSFVGVGSRMNEPSLSTRPAMTSHRSKTGLASEAATAIGDPRPATSKLKSSHPQISVRNRNRKDPNRTRANSTASQRSDASHMLPPSGGRPSNPSPHSHAHAAHNPPPPHRLPSVEPPPTSLYAGPVSNPNQPHYGTPPGSSGGPSQQAPTGNREFSSGFDAGGFHGSSPASYGPSFPPQSGPSLPVPSQVGFDGFNLAPPPSGQGRGGMPMGNSEPSPYPFGAANGMDRPGPVGMHQPSGFDALGGLPSATSESPQDRPFSRNPVEGRNQARGTDDHAIGPGPPMQSLDHPGQQAAHPPLHPPQTFHHPPSHMQQGWSTPDYSTWSYYNN